MRYLEIMWPFFSVALDPLHCYGNHSSKFLGTLPPRSDVNSFSFIRRIYHLLGLFTSFWDRLVCCLYGDTLTANGIWDIYTLFTHIFMDVHVFSLLPTLLPTTAMPRVVMWIAHCMLAYAHCFFLHEPSFHSCFDHIGVKRQSADQRTGVLGTQLQESLAYPNSSPTTDRSYLRFCPSPWFSLSLCLCQGCFVW